MGHFVSLQTGRDNLSSNPYAFDLMGIGAKSGFCLWIYWDR